MKERLYRALNIKHSEARQVFDLITVQFYIGLANALVNIIAFTLFVYNFPISSLPKVYLVIAAVLLVLNLVYEKLEHMFSPVQLLKYIIGFTAILLIILWVGLNFIDKGNFIFVLLVSSVLIYMVAGYAFWGLVSLLFNVRESRRVFSIVGSGDIPAKLVGYIIAPLLVPLLGLNNLLWLAAFSLFVGLYLFNKFTKKEAWDQIKNKTHATHHHVKTHFKSKDLVSFFFKSKLIFAISLLSILSYNVFVLVDFTFISQVKLRYEKINDLATYIAIFFASGRLIALGLKLIFTSRLIERLGVIYCLFITPAALFLFCLIFLVFGSDPTYNIYIFGLMAMLTEVLRSTMQEPVFFILFQPLKENLRLKGHIISKGYMYPPAFIIVGLSLLFCYNAGIEISIMIAVKIVIINLCVWAVIIFFIRRAYLDTVHASIKKGIFNTDEIYITDQKAIEILLNKIEAGKKIEVIYALNVLEQSGYKGFKELLESQLAEGKDVAVKKFVLERLESMEMVDVSVLKSLLPVEQDTELKQKIIALLCKYDPGFLKNISENINSHEYAIRKIIIINLLNHHEFDYLFRAGTEINSLLNSQDAGERELAVEIISELKHVQFSDAIERLIDDEAIAVKRIAIMTACKLKMQSLLPSIIAHLDQPMHRNIVLKGLQVYGDDLFEDLTVLSVNIPVKYLPDFIKIAGKLKGKHSTAFLISKLDDDNASMKDMILHSLWMKEYEPSGNDEKEKFTALLNCYLKEGLDKQKDYNEIPDYSDKDLVKRSIYNEVKNDLAISLKACAILFRTKEINRILQLMEVDKQDKLYNVMEMLELVLPKKISKDINSLFDFILDPHHSKKILVKHEVKLFFDKVIFTHPLLYNPWTKAVCVYSSWKNNETAFLEKLRDNLQPDEHFLVKETKDYVLAAIK